MTQLKFRRVYHPCDTWEELHHNMWGTVEDRAKYLSMAISFTGNHYLYGHFMKRVIKEWPISCENAFTDTMLNKRAWLGHAACALAFGCPEDIVRQAWSMLNYEQQLLANEQAERYIRIWANNYAKSKGLRNDMETTLL